MPSIDLRLRNLDTAELLIATFECEEDCAIWLADRPPGMEVLGLLVPGAEPDPELHARLKAVVRPMDPAERATMQRLDEADARARAERWAAEARASKQDEETQREAMRTADPKRPMQVSWTAATGYTLVEPMDERVIPDVVKEAVAAWVREREEWVRDRDQVIVEAVVTAWPAEVPAGQDRIQRGGRFVPAARPPKPASSSSSNRSN